MQTNTSANEQIIDLRNKFRGLQSGYEKLSIANQIDKIRTEIEANQAIIEPEKHYSEQIIDILASDYGWENTSTENRSSAQKDVGGGATGGELNPEGARIVHAVFDESGRYLTLQVGFDNIFDMDLRDKDIKTSAKEFDDKVNEWATSTDETKKEKSVPFEVGGIKFEAIKTNDLRRPGKFFWRAKVVETGEMPESYGAESVPKLKAQLEDDLNFGLKGDLDRWHKGFGISQPKPEPETNPHQVHIDTLQSIVDGQHDNDDLAGLLDVIDAAATALIDAGLGDVNDALIGAAAERWAILDEQQNG
jgi:hypothetical protein